MILPMTECKIPKAVGLSIRIKRSRTEDRTVRTELCDYFLPSFAKKKIIQLFNWTI